MTEWKRAKRLMSLYLSHTERFAISICDTNGNAYLCVPDDFDRNIPEEDLTSFRAQRSREYHLDVSYVRPEELDGLFADRQIRTWRIDAVTKPSLLVAYLPNIVDVFLPHVCNRRSISYEHQFPDQILTNIIKAWHGSLWMIGIRKDNTSPLNNLRYTPEGWDFATVADPEIMPRSEEYTYFFSKTMPEQMVSLSHAYLSSVDTLKDYPIDNLWMIRAAAEMIPVHMYQRLVFGEHNIVNRGVGDLYMGESLAPYCNDDTAAKAIFDLNVRYLPVALKYDGETGLADTIGNDNGVYLFERGYWKLRNVGLTIATKPNGLRSCGSKIICVRQSEPLVEYSSQLEGLKMPYANSPIYGMLLAQHADDAIGSVIGDPWED